jgi:hypothetical protein
MIGFTKENSCPYAILAVAETADTGKSAPERYIRRAVEQRRPLLPPRADEMLGDAALARLFAHAVNATIEANALGLRTRSQRHALAAFVVYLSRKLYNMTHGQRSSEEFVEKLVPFVQATSAYANELARETAVETASAPSPMLESLRLSVTLFWQLIVSFAQSPPHER